MTEEHNPEGIDKCERCKEEWRRKTEQGDPPEWFAKTVVAMIAFIIVMITLAIVL